MTDERRRNIKMVYGSLAYDLDTLARERQLEEAAKPQRTAQPERQPQPQTRRRPQAQAKARPSALTEGGIAAVCALVMVLLLGYVQLTAVSNNVSTIKKELATLEDEHVALLTEYEKTFDLATIKAAAEEAVCPSLCRTDPVHRPERRGLRRGVRRRAGRGGEGRFLAEGGGAVPVGIFQLSSPYNDANSKE